MSKRAKREKQRNYERNELAALRILCDEQRQQITELKNLARLMRGDVEEMKRVRKSCEAAGMKSPSMVSMYLEGVFYALKSKMARQEQG